MADVECDVVSKHRERSASMHLGLNPGPLISKLGPVVSSLKPFVLQFPHLCNRVRVLFYYCLFCYS